MPEGDKKVAGLNLDGLTGELAGQITAKLIEILEKQFGGGDILEAIKPLVPAVVEYGLKEGTDAAEILLVGLGQEDPYPHWQALINAADPETRIELMEETRQAAMRENLRKIERNEMRWKVFKTAIQVVITVLGLLLV